MSEEEKEIRNTDGGETDPAKLLWTEEEQETEPYLYAWDYASQCEYDRKKRARTRRRGAVTFAIVMASVFLVCIALLVAVLLIGGRSSDSSSAIPTEDIAETVKPQTVLITVETEDGVGYGTGFFIREDGYLATNYHVVEGADRIEITLYLGKTQVAELVGYSAPDDLAVLKIEGGYYPTVTIGDSDTLRVGATAIAIGHPMGTSYAWTTTQGIISALDRRVSFSDEVAAYEVHMLQMDTPVNTGNSGGPLCNDRGAVIGIVTRKVSGYDYIGLALPINGAMEILYEIIENGSADAIESPLSQMRPLIGITGSTIQKGETYYLENVPYVSAYDGVLISTVSKTGAAVDKMEKGDILVSFNDIPIASMDDLTNVLYGCTLGQTVNFEVIRNGQSVTGTITFQNR